MLDTPKLVQKLDAATQKIIDQLEPEVYRMVPTTRGLAAIVDPELEARLCAFRWFANVSGSTAYAVADIDGKRVSMQRVVVMLTEKLSDISEIKNISFKNKHTFDCRYQNLITAGTRRAMMRNRTGKRNTSSKYKGVRKINRPNGGHYWRAQIAGPFGKLDLGGYEDEAMAAAAYNLAATKLFDEAHLLNQVPELNDNGDLMLTVWLKIERGIARHKQTNPDE